MSALNCSPNARSVLTSSRFRRSLRRRCSWPPQPVTSWDGWRPAAMLEPRLGFPLLLENDANLAALAEALAGAVEGAADVLYIKASSMIGCGLMIKGRLRRGAYGGAGEIGHMILQPGGQLCFCG